MMGLFGAGAVAWWLAAEPSTSTIPTWPVYVFAGIALIGFYCVLAPLLRLPPWGSKEPPDHHSGDKPQTTVVRVRRSRDVRAHDNTGCGTDSAVEADEVDGLDAERNRVLQVPEDPTKGLEDPGDEA